MVPCICRVPGIPGGCLQELSFQFIDSSGQWLWVPQSHCQGYWPGLVLCFINMDVHSTVGCSEKQVQGWLVLIESHIRERGQSTARGMYQ